MQRRISPAKSSRQCWFPAAGAVAVSVGRSLTAHVSGVYRCGSSWSCPVCAPVVRARRAAEVERGVGAHLASGGGAVLLTLTSRHHKGDDLAPRLGVLAESLKLVLKGAGWERRRDRLGFVGSIKALEITYGANGWHPHAHILLLTGRPVTDRERADLHQWIFTRWSRIVAAAGFGTVTSTHGVDLRAVGNIEGLADYLTKVEGEGGRSWNVGQELARADLKRGAGSLVPFEILAGFVATGDADLADLWNEYEHATYGRQSLRWSQGLKALLGVEEVTDVEAAASEGADPDTYFRWLIGQGLWRRLLKDPAGISRALVACETEAANRFAVYDAHGVPLDPLLDHEFTEWVPDDPPD